jgi:hypothetical protein
VIDAPPARTRTTARTTATEQRSRPERSLGRFEGQEEQMGFHDFIKVRKHSFSRGKERMKEDR